MRRIGGGGGGGGGEGMEGRDEEREGGQKREMVERGREGDEE